MPSALKRLLVGPPLASTEEQHQRLGKPTALAVFASDAISSTAYATEEILLVLVPIAGLTVGLSELIPIAIVVGFLLLIVITSYRETVYAYPGGAGSYVVSRENLGERWSLIAGASVLVDYILTVAVSISAGVAAITSAFHGLIDYRVPLCLGFLGVITVANLRGTKESGKLFAGPTYTYITILAVLIVWGLYQVWFGDLGPLAPNEEAIDELSHDGELLTGLTWLILLRAFSSGAVALTGIEAISDGVAAFKKPESRNAATTLIILGGILGSSFMGISLLAEKLRPTPTHEQTLLSIMGEAVFGDGHPLFFVLQFSTFAILILAANTAFADFPRVSSIIARDGYLPRQLANRGDRLVFSNGVLVLAAVAAGLIVAFGGVTSALIPLYAVGVFTGFTLSQAGMFRYHKTSGRKGAARGRIISGLGAVATFIVLMVVLVSKFTIGAWIPAALIPFIVLFFKAIRRHYDHVVASIAIPDDYRSHRKRHTVIVLVGNVHRGVLDAITYARSLAPDRLMALTVVHDTEHQERIQAQWEKFEIPIELRTEYSPYRELSGPVMSFINAIDEEWPDDIITVVVPEFVLTKWWEQALHNQSAFLLRARLRLRPNTVVVAVPIHLDREQATFT
jgi:amino acid transporter